MSEKTFYEYFKESMNSLGLETPDTLFTSFVTAFGTIAAMAAAIKEHGDMTVPALFTMVTGKSLMVARATVAVNVSTALLGVMGAFYLGACIGALFYAHCKVTGDSFPSNNSNSGAWKAIHGAKVAGIEIPNTVLTQMISPNMRSQII